MSAVKVEKLSRKYGAKTVLKDINIDIPQGRRLAVFGSNGSGKTTLIRILSTLLLPTSGEAWICGHSVKNEVGAIRKMIGWAPSTDGGFLSQYTGLENLFFFGSLHDLSSQEVLDQIKVWRQIPSFEFALGTQFSICSNGMKQVLSTARALLGVPQVIFLDEPTHSMDAKAASLTRQILSDRLKGRTLVFSTHSLEEAHELATDRIQIQDGVVVA